MSRSKYALSLAIFGHCFYFLLSTRFPWPSLVIASFSYSSHVCFAHNNPTHPWPSLEATKRPHHVCRLSWPFTHPLSLITLLLLRSQQSQAALAIFGSSEEATPRLQAFLAIRQLALVMPATFMEKCLRVSVVVEWGLFIIIEKSAYQLMCVKGLGHSPTLRLQLSWRSA